MKNYIELENISKLFCSSKNEFYVLTNINLEISRGEFVTVVGPEKSGKSTLLNVLGLLESSSDGRYFFNHRDVGSMGQVELAKFRNSEIGFVFQSLNLIPDLTIFENVELPLIYRGELSSVARKEKVEKSLEKVNMLHRAGHFPNQLSEEQQQRVAIARAVVGEPSTLLADEPTGNLDEKAKARLISIFSALNDEGITIIWFTNDRSITAHTHRVIELSQGKIVRDYLTHAQLASKVPPMLAAESA